MQKEDSKPVIRRSRGVRTIKILVLTDALGNLVRFQLMLAQRFDSEEMLSLGDVIAFGGLIAEKAFNSNSIIAELDERGAAVIISQHPRRIGARPIDPDLYADVT